MIYWVKYLKQYGWPWIVWNSIFRQQDQTEKGGPDQPDGKRPEPVAHQEEEDFLGLDDVPGTTTYHLQKLSLWFLKNLSYIISVGIDHLIL